MIKYVLMNKSNFIAYAVFGILLAASIISLRSKSDVNTVDGLEIVVTSTESNVCPEGMEAHKACFSNEADKTYNKECKRVKIGSDIVYSVSTEFHPAPLKSDRSCQ